MLDRDLAELYEVEVKALNQAVKRNNENLMLELKNNDHLSKTFSNFEKRIRST